MNVVIVLTAGVVSSVVGWCTGLLICPDYGDIGIGAIPWAIGGAAVGAAIGVGVSVAVVS